MRVRAAMAVDPTAVVLGRAAAALTWWSDLAVPTVEVARPAGSRRSVLGIRWRQCRIPPALVLEQHAIRVSCPALSTLELIPELGGTAIDEALRRRAVTLAHLHRALALTPGRPGNQERAWLLADSRDEPWSEAERRFQRDFRALALPYAYATNFRVTMPDGRAHPLDLALPDLLQGFEIDGYAFHGDRTAFERDRELEPGLASLGWQVVRLSAAAVLADDNRLLMKRVGAAVRERARQLGGDRPRTTSRSGCA